MSYTFKKAENIKQEIPPAGLEPAIFRLEVGRVIQLRHGGFFGSYFINLSILDFYKTVGVDVFVTIRLLKYWIWCFPIIVYYTFNCFANIFDEIHKNHNC